MTPIYVNINHDDVDENLLGGCNNVELNIDNDELDIDNDELDGGSDDHVDEMLHDAAIICLIVIIINLRNCLLTL